MNLARRSIILLLAAAAAAAGCSGSPPRAQSSGQTPSLSSLQPAAVRSLAFYGRDLIVHTRRYLKPYLGADMDCAACHVAAGTQPRGGTFVGIAAQFPQWNKRAGRVIALQDRLAECFLYSMDGKPPPYQSREMEAIAAYITALSRGVKIGATPDPAARLASIVLPQPPNRARGAAIFSAKCAACHGVNGQGSGALYPPLWGPRSFNDGAGMHRLRTMAGFVRYNMPQNAPGTLSDRDAYDVAGFVLAHARPHFKRSRIVTFPQQAAGYF